MLVKTSPSRYFHQALQILSGLPPFNKLTKQELLVYGELLLVNHENKDSKRPPIVTSAEIRDRIVKKYDVSPQTVRNIIMKLRRHFFIDNITLNEQYTIEYLQPFNFEFQEVSEG